jgi:integrase
MILDDFYSDKFLPNAQARLRANTVDGYERKYRNHIQPRFGRMELGDVTSYMLEEWVNSIPTPGSARGCWAVMRTILRKAVKWGDLNTDPTVRVDIPKRGLYQPKTLSELEVKQLRKGFRNHFLEAYVIVSVGLGLRRGEAVGLDWEDINPHTGEVRIHRSVQVLNGISVEYSPKTLLSDRSVWLTNQARRRLKRIQRKGKLSGRICGELTANQVSRIYAEHCHDNHLPYVPPTNLRHTWATLAVERGVDIAVVSKCLGHADITTTARYYVRITERMKRSAQRRRFLAR